MINSSRPDAKTQVRCTKRNEVLVDLARIMLKVLDQCEATPMLDEAPSASAMTTVMHHCEIVQCTLTSWPAALFPHRIVESGMSASTLTISARQMPMSDEITLELHT